MASRNAGVGGSDVRSPADLEGGITCRSKRRSPRRPVVVPDAHVTRDVGSAPTAAVGFGWATFAGIMLIVAGFWNFFAGWAALVRKEYFSEASLLYHNLQVVGWVWLGIGVVQVLASFLVFTRRVSGQVLGVVLASVSMFVWFFSIGAYPMWAMMIVAIDALIIYGLTAHGDVFR